MDTRCRLLFLLIAVSTVVCALGVDPTTTTTTTTKSTTTTKPTVTSIKVVTMLDPPFVVMTPRGKRYSGLVADILTEALNGLPYEVTWDIHSDTKFGYEEEPGQWNGLIGAVQNETADVAVAAFTITSNRSQAVDFTQPFMHAGFRVLYKIPDSWSPHEAMVTVLRPFTPGLWVLLVSMFGLTSIALYLIGRYSPYEDVAFVGKAATFEGLTFSNSFLYAFSSLVWQGYTAAPRSFSGRMLTCVWWVFCVFTIAAYIAGLCVVLFRVNPEIRTLPFATVDELSRTNKVRLMVMENGATHQYLQKSSGPLEKRLLLKLLTFSKESFVSHTEDGINKMIQSDGKAVMLMDGPAAEYISSQQPCDKMVIGEAIGDHQYAFACQKGSEVCSKLSTQILKLKESGRISELREKWLHGGCLEDRPQEYIFEGLPFFDTFGGDPEYIMPLTITVKRFSSAFIILLLGIVIAGIILGIEIFYARKRGVAVPRKLERGGIQDDDLARIENDFHDERS